MRGGASGGRGLAGVEDAGEQQIPFGNEHCMQRRRVRAVVAPDGRWLGVAEDAGEQQIPFGNDNKKGKGNNSGKGNGRGVADG